MAPIRYEVVSIEEVPTTNMDDCEPAEPIVLVVDDERVVADTLSLILKRAGFRTMTAYTGKDALVMAERARPALLISDIAMRGMDGIELAQAVVDLMPECKVLLFSGHATYTDLLGARTAGYDFPLLTKPVHPLVILKHVNDLLRPAMQERAAIRPSFGEQRSFSLAAAD